MYMCSNCCDSLDVDLSMCITPYLKNERRWWTHTSTGTPNLPFHIRNAYHVYRIYPITQSSPG